MNTPLKVAVFLLSVHPCSVSPASPTAAHMMVLPTYLPLPQLVTVVTFRLEHLHMMAYQRGIGAWPSASFPGHG